MAWLLASLLVGAVAFLARNAREIPINSVFTRRRSIEK
jgi:hypothetical protein